jgi:hypothetical protein
MRVLTFILVFFLAALAPAQQKAASSMTGFLDQQDTTYILREGRDLKKIADLEPAGFKNDYFANFVGMQVKVFGKISMNGDMPVVHVTKIEKLEP